MDRVREAIEAEQRELRLRLHHLERLLEQYDRPPTRLPAGKTVTYGTSEYPSKQVKSAKLLDQPGVVEAADSAIDYLQENGEWRGPVNDWHVALDLPGTSHRLYAAMRHLKDAGRVVRTVDEGEPVYRLPGDNGDRATVVEPGVGVREGRKVA